MLENKNGSNNLTYFILALICFILSGLVKACLPDILNGRY